MINDELNSRSVNFLGLVVSLDLFSTLSLVYLSILLINNKTPLSNYLDLIKSLFFWILERRFGSCSILQISLRTGNFYYLTRSRQPLVKFGAVAGDPKATFWSFHLTLTIVFVLFLKHFQVEFGWNWVKGILSRFWFGNVYLIDLNFGRQMKIVILIKAHYI